MRVGLLDDKKKGGIRTIRLASFDEFSPTEYISGIPETAAIRKGKGFTTLFMRRYFIAEISFPEKNGEKIPVKYKRSVVFVDRYLSKITMSCPNTEADQPEYE